MAEIPFVPGVLPEGKSTLRIGDDMAENSTQTYVLTGATGFLGSHLLAALLQRGDRVVVLGRRSAGESLAARIDKLLAWFDLRERSGQIETAEVDLLKPLCGLDPERYRALCNKAGQIIHCASDTRFSEQHRQESTATNVDSLGQIIEFAKNSNAPWFNYVSTAYAAGIASEHCPEAPLTSDKFVNVYEETKARAEQEVAAYCTMHSLPFSIIRPAIVYGDSRSGRANRFNALYNHVRSLYYIREIYLKDIHEHGGRKSGEHGIYQDDSGILHIPLRVAAAHRGHINLIPIDYFVSATLSILAHAQAGTFYHITSDHPKTVEDLASYCEAFLNIRGIEVVYGSAPNTAFNPPEALFNRFIEPYLPYLSDTRTFARSNTDAATAGLIPPEFTYDVFKRCMDYAVGVNWGKV
jgi:nucleoside-diphosphate-sugar epimerase